MAPGFPETKPRLLCRPKMCARRGREDEKPARRGGSSVPGKGVGGGVQCPWEGPGGEGEPDDAGGGGDPEDRRRTEAPAYSSGEGRGRGPETFVGILQINKKGRGGIFEPKTSTISGTRR